MLREFHHDGVAASAVPVGLRLRFALSILALLNGLVLAAWLLAPRFEARLDASAAGHVEGFTFIAPVGFRPAFPYWIPADRPGAESSSRLRLYEDGRPLGPAHSEHVQIHRQGGGRYSHWGAQLWFSSSDASDPRTNGRRYDIVTPSSVNALIPASVLAVDLILLLAFRRRLLAAVERNALARAVAVRAHPILSVLGRIVAPQPRGATLPYASRDAAARASTPPAPGASRALAALWPEALFLAVVPPAYLLLGPFQLFPPPGWVDAGMYLGYFLDFPHKLLELGTNYHGMRLPFTLAGFLAHRIFSPDVANYLLVLGFHELALVSVYLAARARHGRVAAVSAALFLALNPLWIATVTRGYIDGPAMAFLFACLACLANRGRAVSAAAAAVLAGAAAALSAFCNPVAGAVTALTALAWLVAERTPWRELLHTVLYGVVGVTAVTLVLGLASWLLNGPFLFFSVSIPFGAQALSGFGANYRRPLGEWVPSAYRLALPVAFLCVGLVFLLGRRRGTAPALLAAGCNALMLTAAGLAFFDVGIGGTMLQSAHYASYLIPGQCLVFGGLAALLRPARDGARPVPKWAAVAAGLSIAGIVPLLDLERLWALEAGWRQSLLLWCVIAWLFLTAAVLMRRRAAGFGLAALMFATAFAGAANADTRRMFRAGPNPDYRPYYHAMVRLHGIVEAVRPPDRPLQIWYCRACFTTGDPERDKWLFVDLRFLGQALPTNPLDSMASLWMWDRSALNAAMPALSAEDVGRLTAAPQGSTLVMLCSNDAACAEAATALRSAGTATHERARLPLAERGLFDLRVSILDVSQAGGP